LERPRLGLVRVDAQVVRLLLLLGHERPLQPGREAPAPASARPRLFHDVDDPRGLHRARLLERGVPPALHPPLVGARVRLAEVAGEEHRLLGMRLVGVAHYLYFLTSSGTFSGVTDSMKSSSTSTGVANPQAPRHSPRSPSTSRPGSWRRAPWRRSSRAAPAPPPRRRRCCG